MLPVILSILSLYIAIGTFIAIASDYSSGPVATDDPNELPKKIWEKYRYWANVFAWPLVMLVAGIYNLWVLYIWWKERPAGGYRKKVKIDSNASRIFFSKQEIREYILSSQMQNPDYVWPASMYQVGKDIEASYFTDYIEALKHANAMNMEIIQHSTVELCKTTNG